jgi:hypothetical protein
VFHSEDHVDDAVINANLPAGAYTLSLASGWNLERIAADGTAQTVEATLTSATPLPFTVVSGGFTPVALQFRTTGVVIDPARGDVAISIGVDDGPMQPVTFGFPTYGGVTDQRQPFVAYAQAITVTQTATLDTLGVIGVAPAPGVTMGLYTDAGNVPGNRIATATWKPTSAIPNATTLSIPNLTIPPGQYWIAVLGVVTIGKVQNVPMVKRCDSNFTGGQLPNSPGAWSCNPQSNNALNVFASGVH